VKRAVAFLFARKSTTDMAERDFLMAASMDLRWFDYSAAQRFLDTAASLGLVVREGERIRVTFDPTGVSVPLDFTPPPDLITAVPRGEDLFEEILQRIVATGGLDAKAAIARINEKQERQNVEIVVAALLVLADLGEEARSLAPRVLAALRGG